jgi:hypothetical protein
MVLKSFNYIQGSHSTVFVDREGKYAYKVFKSYQSLDTTHKRDFKEDEYNKWKKEIYKTEIDAYDKISDSKIKKYFPKKYDDFIIDKILDEDDLDISDLFLLDCIIMIDFINGESIKQNDSRVAIFCKEHNIDLQGVFNELNKIGVYFHIDSSVFCNQNYIKIIDIATKDFVDFQPIM